MGIKVVKKTTKHHQLATTGHAEGMCMGGKPKGYAKGGLIKTGGGTKMKSSKC